MITLLAWDMASPLWSATRIIFVPPCSKKLSEGGRDWGDKEQLFRIENERGDTRGKQPPFPQPGTSGHYYKGLNL